MRTFCIRDTYNECEDILFVVPDEQLDEALYIAEHAVQEFEDNEMDDIDLHEAFGGVSDYVAYCLTSKQINWETVDIEKVITY